MKIPIFFCSLFLSPKMPLCAPKLRTCTIIIHIYSMNFIDVKFTSTVDKKNTCVILQISKDPFLCWTHFIQASDTQSSGVQIACPSVFFLRHVRRALPLFTFHFATLESFRPCRWSEVRQRRMRKRSVAIAKWNGKYCFSGRFIRTRAMVNSELQWCIYIYLVMLYFFSMHARKGGGFLVSASPTLLC